MPCGMNMDDLIARLKARGEPGTTEAEEILEQMLAGGSDGPAQAEGPDKLT